MSGGVPRVRQNFKLRKVMTMRFCSNKNRLRHRHSFCHSFLVLSNRQRGHTTQTQHTHYPKTHHHTTIVIMMMFPKFLFIALASCSSSLLVTAQNRNVQSNVQMGMEGLLQSAQDPELMAQLFQDMQNPEMMAAAKEMMADPEFQKEMKRLQNSKEFKQATKATTEMLKDPNTAAATEAKAEHMLKVGNEKLQKNAQNAMQEAISAMGDPEVMAEMTKMIKDPNFNKQLQEMANDPQFKNYMDAMQEMMKDPVQKKKITEATQNIKAQL